MSASAEYDSRMQRMREQAAALNDEQLEKAFLQSLGRGSQDWEWLSVLSAERESRGGGTA
ncbi:Uncharacterised protein (plasmid) [Tsukamurella tyrosinosolvens]|uniref:Uncharacterized protein n=1 Tax=Tsukamurella tyrosinosolvens TaxID=57704 RepID=A0A1H4UE20_TSUTY|nr:hypothetical protein [Tsukamurella tyrosinosolvens]KXO92950.1 hypothetical protein AXK58_13855 [Tsukamurella tyrosinosolvens]SEC66883.1 hypothetical protein SAMN04489793_2867 [Tsukamurella tyrosinosolvens]VEH94155.1 Uncharacterised protein [Tsukamurella tyrosinosolvens]